MAGANVTNCYEASRFDRRIFIALPGSRGDGGGTSVSEMLRDEAPASATERVGDKAGELAERAQEKVGPAVGQAQDRVRVEVDRRSTRAGDQLSATAGALRHTSRELRTNGNDPQATVADAAAERMEQAASTCRGAENADRILADVEDLARRQPMVVAAGGLMLGLAAARFLKASSDRRYEAAYRTRMSER